MHRRRFLVTSLAGALAAPLGAEAQPDKNFSTLAWLSTGMLFSLIFMGCNLAESQLLPGSGAPIVSLLLADDSGS